MNCTTCRPGAFSAVNTGNGTDMLERHYPHCNSMVFDHEGLRQVQNRFVPDEDLRDQKIVSYYCNLLCYVKCSTSLLTFKVVAVSACHIIFSGWLQREATAPIEPILRWRLWTNSHRSGRSSVSAPEETSEWGNGGRSLWCRWWGEFCYLECTVHDMKLTSCLK